MLLQCLEQCLITEKVLIIQKWGKILINPKQNLIWTIQNTQKSIETASIILKNPKQPSSRPFPNSLRDTGTAGIIFQNVAGDPTKQGLLMNTFS